ncbi:hypothetical protein J6590_055485 [Homalodisca vitripennis]|nr:hypothetical protein J6590_055485 [Homalodisca vitripennis]
MQDIVTLAAHISVHFKTSINPRKRRFPHRRDVMVTLTGSQRININLTESRSVLDKWLQHRIHLSNPYCTTLAWQLGIY